MNAQLCPRLVFKHQITWNEGSWNAEDSGAGLRRCWSSVLALPKTWFFLYIWEVGSRFCKVFYPDCHFKQLGIRCLVVLQDLSLHLATSQLLPQCTWSHQEPRGSMGKQHQLNGIPVVLDMRIFSKLVWYLQHWEHTHYHSWHSSSVNITLAQISDLDQPVSYCKASQMFFAVTALRRKKRHQSVSQSKTDGQFYVSMCEMMNRLHQLHNDMIAWAHCVTQNLESAGRIRWSQESF